MKFSEMPYKRIDFDALREEFASLIRELETADSAEKQFDVHQKYYRIADDVMTQMSIAEIRHDIDVTDSFYAAEQDFYDANMPLYTSMATAYQEKLLASPFRAELEKIIGSVAFTNMELARDSVKPSLIALMQEENALQTRYNKILASARIEWQGQVLNLSLMQPYLHHTDRSIRAAAYDRYTAFFTANQEEIEDIYDRLVKNRTAQAKALGEENYLPLGYRRMRRNCYTRSDVADFRSQVKKDLVPFCQKLTERRRQRLGLDHLLYIDEGIYFPQGNPAPLGTPEEIMRAGLKMYRELSPETASFMNLMCENELFDVLGRKTKKTGGYMTYLPDYHVPYIFANFNGTSGDTDVITHECGHAFQYFVVADTPIHEHLDITNEAAETHSMSMEYFTEPWMNLFYGSRAGDYVEMHAEDQILFIPYGTMVDEFQDIVYSNPGLTPAARNQAWRDLERQYKPHLDYTGNAYMEQGCFWQKQHHIFDSPLYYIDYCLAETGALQYRNWMHRDFKAAWDSYLKLCRLSASDYYTNMIPAVGLTLPFTPGCLAHIVSQLEAEMKLQ